MNRLSEVFNKQVFHNRRVPFVMVQHMCNNCKAHGKYHLQNRKMKLGLYITQADSVCTECGCQDMSPVQSYIPASKSYVVMIDKKPHLYINVNGKPIRDNRGHFVKKANIIPMDRDKVYKVNRQQAALGYMLPVVNLDK